MMIDSKAASRLADDRNVGQSWGATMPIDLFTVRNFKTASGLAFCLAMLPAASHAFTQDDHRRDFQKLAKYLRQWSFRRQVSPADPVRTCPLTIHKPEWTEVAASSTVYTSSSVQTLKLTSVFGPKV
jgi:hypothetical protein